MTTGFHVEPQTYITYGQGSVELSEKLAELMERARTDDGTGTAFTAMRRGLPGGSTGGDIPSFGEPANTGDPRNFLEQAAGTVAQTAAAGGRIARDAAVDFGTRFAYDTGADAATDAQSEGERRAAREKGFS